MTKQKQEGPKGKRGRPKGSKNLIPVYRPRGKAGQKAKAEQQKENA